MRTMSNSTWLPQNVVLWAACRNDSRYPQLLTNNEKGDEVRFDRFPAPKRWKASEEKRKRWIVAYVVAAIPLSLCAERQLYLQSTFH